MSYKLLALDVDGTLIRRDGSIHDDDLDAIRRLQAAGVPVTLATGRLYSGTREIARSAGISGPLACIDGADIVHTDGDERLYSRTLAGAHAGALRSIVDRHDAACFLFAQDAIVHDASGAPFADYVRTWSPAIAVVERVTAHPCWDHDHGLHALVAVGDEASIRGAEEQIRGELEAAVAIFSFPVSRGGGLFAMVVRAHGPTKGTAIAWLAAHHGCAPSEVVVVGDWINDVPMFQAAGRSFAMAQAPEQVKAAATDRLLSSGLRGGGVAEAIARAFGR
ncbi:MAG: HAD family phosphatase [Polyangiaceae bacterium]|nr:HAD family phosphatase [Polyangiaceae bacterium]